MDSNEVITLLANFLLHLIPGLKDSTINILDTGILVFLFFFGIEGGDNAAGFIEPDVATFAVGFAIKERRLFSRRKRLAVDILEDLSGAVGQRGRVVNRSWFIIVGQIWSWSHAMASFISFQFPPHLKDIVALSVGDLGNGNLLLPELQGGIFDGVYPVVLRKANQTALAIGETLKAVKEDDLFFLETVIKDFFRRRSNNRSRSGAATSCATRIGRRVVLVGVATFALAPTGVVDSW